MIPHLCHRLSGATVFIHHQLRKSKKTVTLFPLHNIYFTHTYANPPMAQIVALLTWTKTCTGPRSTNVHLHSKKNIHIHSDPASAYRFKLIFRGNEFSWVLVGSLYAHIGFMSGPYRTFRNCSSVKVSGWVGLSISLVVLSRDASNPLQPIIKWPLKALSTTINNQLTMASNHTATWRWWFADQWLTE